MKSLCQLTKTHAALGRSLFEMQGGYTAVKYPNWKKTITASSVMK